MVINSKLHSIYVRVLIIKGIPIQWLFIQKAGKWGNYGISVFQQLMWVIVVTKDYSDELHLNEMGSLSSKGFMHGQRKSRMFLPQVYQLPGTLEISILRYQGLRELPVSKKFTVDSWTENPARMKTKYSNRKGYLRKLSNEYLKPRAK